MNLRLIIHEDVEINTETISEEDLQFLKDCTVLFLNDSNKTIFSQKIHLDFKDLRRVMSIIGDNSINPLVILYNWQESNDTKFHMYNRSYLSHVL